MLVECVDDLKLISEFAYVSGPRIDNAPPILDLSHRGDWPGFAVQVDLPCTVAELVRSIGVPEELPTGRRRAPDPTQHTRPTAPSLASTV